MWQSELWALQLIMESLRILWKGRKKTPTPLVSKGLGSQIHASALELDTSLTDERQTGEGVANRYQRWECLLLFLHS